METRQTKIRELVGRLNNLHEIFRVQGEILSWGEETIEPLTELLLSPPSTFPEPRVAAAECLGTMGGDKAIDALIRVLDYHDVLGLGPVQRMAEDTVRNAAARQLTRFRQAHVIDALLSSLGRDHLIGAGEALAALGETSAIPYLIECLEDDVKKRRASEALLSFGHTVVPYFQEAVLRPRLIEGIEPPLSQERRARIAELLAQLKAYEALPALENGLLDNSSQVRIACAIALSEIKGAEAGDAIPQLIAGLEDSEVFVRINCEEALEKIGSAALSLLARATAGEPLRVPHSEETRLSVRGRATAVKLIGKIGEPESVPFLIPLLDDPELMVRQAALMALGHFSDQRAEAGVLRAATEGPSNSIRITARAILKRRREREGPVEKVSPLRNAIGGIKRLLDWH